MEFRPLEIKILSAKDLKSVNHFTKMDVYVVGSISGDRRTAQRTNVDKDGGTSPKWNYPMKFTLDESLLQQNRLTLDLQLRSDRTLGDKEIGSVHVPIKELIDNAAGNKSDRSVTYKVVKPSGKPKGTLDFSYKFGEPFAAPAMKTGEPVTAYPAGVGSSSAYPPPGAYYAPPPQGPYPPNGYPPQPAGYGYPPPPPQGYGYPQAAGYGYQQPPRRNNNKLGLGLGAGLLGGLLVGDMISDAGAYDAGYDNGFDDAGGFDGGFDF